ncbi:HD domain-containing protein [Parasphingorhabdus pacifica]
MNIDGEPLAERNPLPEVLPARLRAQFGFLIEVDKLKTILRQSPLAAEQRRENDAEHSWNLALMVPVLAEYADEPIDVARTTKLVVLHDLIEIYAGDTPLYDDEGRTGQQAREEAAADRIFGLLPEDQAGEFRELWDEFEARRTPEARFAKATDRLQPLLLNWMDRGGTWPDSRHHGRHRACAQSRHRRRVGTAVGRRQGIDRRGRAPWLGAAGNGIGVGGRLGRTAGARVRCGPGVILAVVPAEIPLFRPSVRCGLRLRAESGGQPPVSRSSG